MVIKNFANPKLGDIRIAYNEKGEIFFCLSDVCKILELANPSQVKARLDSSNLISMEVTTKSANRHGEFTRTISMTYIGEANLYRCIFQSKKEEAKDFQKWVFDEVLPQIRKTGGYIPVEAEDDEKTLLAKALNIMKRTLEEKEKIIEEQRPMATLGRQVTGSDRNIMVGEMAKILYENGVDIGRQRLFDWLRENGYIFKQSREPTQKWVQMGIMTVRECWITTNHGMELAVTPMITGKGQQHFLNIFVGGDNVVIE
ncbi:MAG: phage antirepressor KilAC domain-containing protein [Prevotella sp.]|nr:phage antirepressor KilAC domain-containing protein [Prevotella sp.]